MTKTRKTPALNVKTNLKSGGLCMNHSARALKVRAGVRAAGLCMNHSARVLTLRAGRIASR